MQSITSLKYKTGAIPARLSPLEVENQAEVVDGELDHGVVTVEGVEVGGAAFQAVSSSLRDPSGRPWVPGPGRGAVQQRVDEPTDRGERLIKGASGVEE